MRVGEAGTNKRLEDSKITVKEGGQSILNDKRVNAELLVPIAKAGNYQITVHHDGYFDSVTTMSINCPLPWDSCEKCQEGLDTLIPLFKEQNEIGPGNWSASITWSQSGVNRISQRIKDLVRGIKVHGNDYRVNGYKTGGCVYPKASYLSKPECKASYLMPPPMREKRETQNPTTITFVKDREYVYYIEFRVPWPDCVNRRRKPYYPRFFNITRYHIWMRGNHKEYG